MEEEKGISLGEIFKVIFKRIWWVVAAAAAVMIVLVCLVQFWYNPNKQSYTASFELRLPSGDTYPDGTALRLADSVLLENLQIIKDESLLPEAKRTGKFADIDIEKMVEEDDIEFLQTIEKKEDDTYEYFNTIKVTKKYFKNKEQAADFVRAVVEFPVTKSMYIVENINYFERLSRIDLYDNYNERVNALIDQKNYIVSIYQELANKYSGTYVPEGLNSTLTLDDYIRSFVNYFDSTKQNEIWNKINDKRYIYDTETYVNNAQTEINLIQRDIEKNELLIKALKAERDALLAQLKDDYVKEIEPYETKIADLVVQNVNLQYSISEKEKNLESILNYTEGAGKAEKDALDKELADIREELVEFTKTAVKVRIATYEDKAEVIYVNNKIVAKGGLNIIIAAGLGAVLGFVIAGAVIFIIDYPKYKRAKQAAEGDAPTEESEKPESEEKA